MITDALEPNPDNNDADTSETDRGDSEAADASEKDPPVVYRSFFDG